MVSSVLGLEKETHSWS